MQIVVLYEYMYNHWLLTYTCNKIIIHDLPEA